MITDRLQAERCRSRSKDGGSQRPGWGNCQCNVSKKTFCRVPAGIRREAWALLVARVRPYTFCGYVIGTPAITPLNDGKRIGAEAGLLTSTIGLVLCVDYDEMSR